MAATLAAAKDHIVSGVPLSRIGEPDDVGGTCVFLSSKAGSYINGCALLPPPFSARGELANEWTRSAIIPLDGGSLVSAKL